MRTPGGEVNLGDGPAVGAFQVSQSRGVFVGVREFDRFPRPDGTRRAYYVEVPYAADDAVDTAHKFFELGLIEKKNIVILLGGEPQKQTSLERLKDLQDGGATVGPATLSRITAEIDAAASATGTDGILVVTFATHGMEDRLLTQDSAEAAAAEAPAGLSIATIYRKVSASTAGRKILIYDACRERRDEAARQTASATAPPLSDAHREALGEARGLIVYNATPPGGYAYDDEGLKNGVFTAAMLRGLGGAAKPDGNYITPLTLSMYVDKEVKTWVTNNRKDRESLGIDFHPQPFGLQSLPLMEHPDLKRARDRRQTLLTGLLKAIEDSNGEVKGEHYDAISRILRENENPVCRSVLDDKLDLLKTNGNRYASDFARWWNTEGRDLCSTRPPVGGNVLRAGSDAPRQAEPPAANNTAAPEAPARPPAPVLDVDPSSPMSTITLGVPATGALEPTDPTRENGARYDLWRFQGRKDQRLQIRMGSSSFDDYLMLVRGQGSFGEESDILAVDDDGGGGEDFLDARIFASLPADGAYTIVATSANSEQTGAYTLSLDEAPAALPIEIDKPMTWRLTPSGQGENVDLWNFTGERGDTIEATLRSSVFDAYLYLVRGTDFDRANILAEDDDGGGGDLGLDSRVVATLPDSGAYTLVAAVSPLAVEGTSGGDYTIALKRPEPELTAEPLPPNGNAEGSLSAADPLGSAENRDRIFVPEGSYYDVWTLEGQAGQRIQATLRSEDMDAYLILLKGAPGAPELELVDFNDDGGGGEQGLDSRVVATLPDSGTYTLVASSAIADEGSYTLTVTRLDQQLEADVPASGRLEASDRLREGRSFDTWVLEGKAGQRVAITLTSTEFNPYLFLARGTSRVFADLDVLAEDDDSAGNQNSHIAITLPEEGAYTVVVSSRRTNERGEYTLLLESFGEGMLLNAPASGRLDLSDRMRDNLSFFDLWAFDGFAGMSVEILLRSEEMDPYVYLVRGTPRNLAGVDVLAEDNNGGGSLDARISTTLPADGTYSIVVTTVARAVGDYTVTLETPPPPLEIGAPATGRLEPGDRRIQSGPFFDPWSFRGRSGQIVDVVVRSKEFAPSVYVTRGSPAGNDPETWPIIARNSGGLEAGTARLSVVLPEDAAYTLVASSGEDSLQGSYALSIENRAIGPPPQPIQLGRAASGRLEPEDPLDNWGILYDAWVFEGRKDQQVQVTLRSDDFDAEAFLVRGAQRTLVYDSILGQNDDNGDDLSARFLTRLPEDGPYTVFTSSHTAGTGSYTLTVGELPPPVRLQLNRSADGRIDSTDRFLGSGKGYDLWLFEGRAGQTIRVTMRAGEQDAYVYLIRGTARDFDQVNPLDLLGENDDGPVTGSLDSSLLLTLPETGAYTIVATTAGGGEASYSLLVEEVPAN